MSTPFWFKRDEDVQPAEQNAGLKERDHEPVDSGSRLNLVEQMHEASETNIPVIVRLNLAR